MKKNYTIELLRFLFAIFIILYHYFSYILRNTPSPKLFMHAYIGDEFFFMVSGFFLGNSIMKKLDNTTTINQGGYLISRIKGIALPYYVSWLLAFIAAHLPFVLKSFTSDLSNSVYELLFIDMAGFKVGYYVNEVAWYVSALFMNILIWAPIAEHFRDKYFNRIAPALSIFLYGLLALNTSDLYAPHTIMYGFIYKGMIRCAAGVNAGFTLYGLYKREKFVELLNNHRKSSAFVQIISFVIIFAYMVLPTDKPEDLRDYTIVILIFIFLAMVLCSASIIENKLQDNRFVLWLGRFSVYIYFSQAIIYTHKKILQDWSTSNFIKLPVWVALCLFAAFIVYGISKLIQFVFNKTKYCNND